MEFIEKKTGYDYSLKIMLLGEASVGKTIFCDRLVFSNDINHFNFLKSNCLSTIGIDLSFSLIKYKEKIFQLKICDFAGWGNCYESNKALIKGSVAVLLFYNAFYRHSFNKAKDLYETYFPINKDAVFILVRSKYEVNLDPVIKNKYFVSDEEALEYINDKNNFYFAHISSFEKYETGIKNLIEIILFYYLKNKNKFE